MLKRKLVGLRALEPGDAEAFHRWHLDPEFSALNGVSYPTSRETWEDFIQSAQLPSGTGVTFGIEVEPFGLIGYLALKRIRSEGRSAEFGIAIAREHWNAGFGRDATMTVLRYAFRELNLHRVNLTVADYNERVRHMYARCGFMEEGRLREALYRNGRYHDNIVMSILDREFDEALSSDTRQAD